MDTNEEKRQWNERTREKVLEINRWIDLKILSVIWFYCACILVSYLPNIEWERIQCVYNRVFMLGVDVFCSKF